VAQDVGSDFKPWHHQINKLINKKQNAKWYIHMILLITNVIYLFIYLAVLGMETRAFQILGKH
jgi:hypothetical protein